MKVGDPFNNAVERTRSCEADGTVQLARQPPPLLGTFLVLGIRNVAFNQETVEIGALNAMKYPIKKGRVISHTCEVEYLD